MTILDTNFEEVILLTSVSRKPWFDKIKLEWSINYGFEF